MDLLPAGCSYNPYPHHRHQRIPTAPATQHANHIVFGRLAIISSPATKGLTGAGGGILCGSYTRPGLAPSRARAPEPNGKSPIRCTLVRPGTHEPHLGSLTGLDRTEHHPHARHAAGAPCSAPAPRNKQLRCQAFTVRGAFPKLSHDCAARRNT